MKTLNTIPMPCPKLVTAIRIEYIEAAIDGKVGHPEKEKRSYLF